MGMSDEKSSSTNNGKSRFPSASETSNPFINGYKGKQTMEIEMKKQYNPFTDNATANKKFEQTLAECKEIKERNQYQTMVPTKPFHADKFNQMNHKPANDIMDSWG